MSETAHTPGPWLRGAPSKNHILENNEARSLIAVVSSWSQGGQQRTEAAEANAHLIAAAPDLLAVAKMAVAICRMEIGMDSEPDFSPDYLLKTALAAIAKAEGRS